MVKNNKTAKKDHFVIELECVRLSGKMCAMLLDRGNDGIMIIQDGSLVYGNNKLLKMTGFSLTEVTGKSFMDFIAPKHRKTVMTNYGNRIAGRAAPEKYEIEILTRNNKKIPIEITASIIEYNDKPANMVIVRDLTQYKQAMGALKESEEKYRVLFDEARDGIVLVDDKKAYITSCNPEFENQTGRKLKELKELAIWDLCPPEQMDKAREIFLEISGQGSGGSGDLKFQKPDGTLVPVEFLARELMLNGKRYIYSIARDITERKLAEETLRASELRHRTTLDNMLEGCQIIDFNWRYVYLNETAVSQSHRSRKDLLGHTMMEVYPGIDETDMFIHLRQCMKERVPHNMENLFNFPDGSQGYFELHIEPVPEGIFVLSLDITERKKMEQSLLKTNRALKVLGQSNQALIHSTDESQLLNELCRIIVEDGGYRLAWVGYAEQDKAKTARVVGQYGLDDGYLKTVKVTWADKERGRGPTGKAIRTGKTQVVRGVQDDPSYVPWREEAKKRGFSSSIALPLIGEDLAFGSLNIYAAEEDAFNQEEVTLLQEMADDLSYGIMSLRAKLKNEETQRVIRENEQRYQTLVENLPQKIFLKNTNLEYVSCNEKYARDLNIKPKEIAGKTDFDFFPKELAEKYRKDDRRIIKSGKMEREEISYIQDKQEKVIELFKVPVRGEDGGVTGVLGIFHDITERKQMEEQLIVTDRLASVGELAAGIAHEMNNPLTGVIGFSDLLAERTDIPDDAREDIQLINREARRTADVVKNLLTFARKHDTQKTFVDINKVIQSVLELRTYEQKVHNIEVKASLAPDLPDITADAFRLQQVFINIIINAEHFMIESHGRGLLTIVTEKVGDMVRASFTDDGPGISKENISHLFDAFFTTKEVGKGTGLGLSISHGIVTEDGGKIYARSQLGKGATFVVELPIKGKKYKQG